MKVGILAAGKGERLQINGVSIPKPLVPIAGIPLIGRALAAVQHIGAQEAVCIVNASFPEVMHYCHEREWGVSLRLLSKHTAHSLESLLACISQLPEADGVLAVTSFVDDEKPLWVALGANERILRLGPSARTGGFVTAGLYYFTPAIFHEAETARRERFTALRQFLGHLVECGYKLYGHRIAKVVDVDRPSDIDVAEAFLAEEKSG